MCTQARMPPSSRRNDSASSKSFAVSGSTVYVGSSRRSTRPSRSRLGCARAARTRLRAPVPTSSASSTFSIRIAGPSTCSTRARPRPVCTTARSPAETSPIPFDSRTTRHAGREVRLADDELPAAADLDDERWAAVSQTWRKRRMVRPEPSAPTPRPPEDQRQCDHRERQRVHVGVVRQSEAGSQAGTATPCRSRGSRSRAPTPRARRAAPRA